MTSFQLPGVQSDREPLRLAVESTRGDTTSRAAALMATSELFSRLIWPHHARRENKPRDFDGCVCNFLIPKNNIHVFEDL